MTSVKLRIIESYFEIRGTDIRVINPISEIRLLYRKRNTKITANLYTFNKIQGKKIRANLSILVLKWVEGERESGRKDVPGELAMLRRCYKAGSESWASRYAGERPIEKKVA